MDSIVPSVWTIPVQAQKCPALYMLQNCGLMLQPCHWYMTSIASRSREKFIPCSALLRPYLEYWAEFWAPSCRKGANKLEGVWYRATRVVRVWSTWHRRRGWRKWVCLIWRKESWKGFSGCLQLPTEVYWEGSLGGTLWKEKR